MSIYTISQSAYDRQNEQLSKEFDIEYTQIDCTDAERTFETYHNLRFGPSRTGRTKEDFTDEWKKKISQSKKGQVRKQSTEERNLRSEKAQHQDMALCKGRIWVNDGVRSFRIHPEQLLDHPEYIKGRL